MTEPESQRPGPEVKPDGNATTTANTNPKRKKGSRTRLCLLALLFIALATALTVGLVLHFRNESDDEDGAPVSAARSGAIVDCLPELRRQKDKMEESEKQCLDRG